MPSGWDVYYVVFLSALMALGIPAVLGLMTIIVSRRDVRSRGDVKHATESLSGGEGHAPITRRTNARFFLAANVAISLIALVLLLVPVVGTFQRGESSVVLLRGLMLVLSVGTFAALGLGYAASKRDLSWLRSHQCASKRNSRS
jgi:NADH:ubiquinone oxidoreductase subunit 3 (subunit A)